MIYSVFNDKVDRFGDHTAFVLEDSRRLTYAQANCVVDNIATYLSSLGVKQGDRVGVMLAFESLHPFVFYALDKLNASYVPFDMNMPEGQLNMDVEKLGLARMITDNELSSLAPFEGGRAGLGEGVVIALPRDNNIPTYLVASSGTSRNKKWMGIKGAGLGYWEKTEEVQLDLKPGHKVLCTRSPAYDARISEYLRALTAGGELHLIRRDQRRDMDYIVNYCTKNNITELLMIASQLNVDNIESIIQKLAEGALKNLMVTGDACSPKLQSLCEKYKISLVNAYGPTEACFGVSLEVVNGRNLLDDRGHPVVPIGLPFGDEIKIHLVDGRVYIQSPYLIDGYISNPEATEKLFRTLSIDGRDVKVFDTGDRADLIEGKLRFKERDESSNDCKINGVKVDKQDTENRLIRLCSEDRAFVNAVVVSKVVDGDTKLVAYLVTKNGFDVIRLNDALYKQLLPEQVPSLISIPELPVLVVSQKIDKQALIARLDCPEEFMLGGALGIWPDNAIINQLRAIWSDLLGFEPTDIKSNFEHCGMDSLKRTRFVTVLQRTFDNKITMLDILAIPERERTIERFEKLIAGKGFGNYKHNNAILSFLGMPFDINKRNLYILPDLLGQSPYSELASSIQLNRNDVNIFGLSDPGVHEESLIEKTFDQMIDQYVNAIIENERPSEHKDVIYLAGFSFGCFLAYHVSLHLIEKGYRVKEMHLIDGFPPLYYRLQTNEEHANLMLNLYQFVAKILNGEIYGETIAPIKNHRLTGVSKTAQIHAVFNHLTRQVSGDSSRRMLKVAKQHLLYLLNDATQAVAHIPITRVYFSNPDQEFFIILRNLPDLFYPNQSVTFGLWDAYFLNITKCSSLSMAGHLDLIHKKSNSTLFFAYEKNNRSVWKTEHDSLALEPLVLLQNIHEGQTRLTICHVLLKEAISLEKSLAELGCLDITSFHYLSKKTIHENTCDERSIAEFALSVIIDGSNVHEIFKAVEWTCLEKVRLIDRRCRSESALINEYVTDYFRLQFLFSSENDLIMETSYTCQGDPKYLIKQVNSLLRNYHLKIHSSDGFVMIAVSTFHDEHVYTSIDLVNHLIRKITPEILPFTIRAARKDVRMEHVKHFFSRAKNFKSSPRSF